MADLSTTSKRLLNDAYRATRREPSLYTRLLVALLHRGTPRSLALLYRLEFAPWFARRNRHDMREWRRFQRTFLTGA